MALPNGVRWRAGSKAVFTLRSVWEISLKSSRRKRNFQTSLALTATENWWRESVYFIVHELGVSGFAV